MENQKNIVTPKRATNEAINLYLKNNQTDEYPDLEQLFTWLLEERKWLYEENEKLEEELYNLRKTDLELDRQYKQFMVKHGANIGKEGV